MSDIQTWIMIVGPFSLMLAFMTMLLRMTGETLDERFHALTTVMGARFDKQAAVMDTRFDQVDKRFDQVDKRFEHVDRRLEHVEHRLDRIEDNISGLNRDVTVLTRRLMGPEAS